MPVQTGIFQELKTIFMHPLLYDKNKGDRQQKHSDILVTDKGFPGVMIRLKGELEQVGFVKTVKTEKTEQAEGGEPLVKAGSGCSLGRLLSWCTQQGMSGLEFMTGIPGSVGGAVRMNAGALSGEIGDRLHSVECVDACGSVIQVPRSELQLSYRKAELVGRDIDALIIASVRFRLIPGAQEEIRSRCTDFLAQRKGKQPDAADHRFLRSKLRHSSGQHHPQSREYPS
ncbi:MAG: FAD-binding protein [Candidatus Electrothrix sp. AR1]|nr:FAD-binding protein [Candidatus Electrothrix sp. AR1]